jgi:membrane protein involved in colicin uptake
MTDSPADDARLRATETQMRHALGLRDGSSSRSPISGSQPQRRRFVRDGEVSVTVIRRDHQPDGEHGANQLDAARQAIRSEAAARERAERLLAEAEVSIRDLQTKLAHERLAKNEALEAVQRAETKAQAAAKAQETAEAELAAERVARRDAEDALAETLEGRQEAERRLRDAIVARTVHRPSKPSITRRAAVVPVGAASVDVDAPDSASELHAHEMPHMIGTAEAPTIVEDGPRRKQAPRRGRPLKVGNQESKVVEWWKPGWQRKSR